MFKSVAIVTSAAFVFTVSLAARGGQDPVSGRQPTDQRPLGSQKSIDLSTDLSAAQRSTKARLDKLSGAAFDRVYIAQMVKDHQIDIREFETASKLSDPDVRGFVEKTLPALRHHLEEAQRIEKALPAAGAGK